MRIVKKALLAKGSFFPGPICFCDWILAEIYPRNKHSTLRLLKNNGNFKIANDSTKCHAPPFVNESEAHLRDTTTGVFPIFVPPYMAI